jgi:hypothetical protein
MGPEAVAARTARVFLFLLPGSRPRRRAGEGAAVAIDAAFFPLPFGRRGPRFLEAPSPPMAGAAPIEAAAAGVAVVVAVAARAAMFFWLQLPFGWPRLQDTGGIATGLVIFFPLPFGWPGAHFSEASSPPMLGPPREYMVRLRSDRKIETGEEAGCAFDPERPQHLKRSNAGEGAGVIGSAMPNASVTTLFSLHRAHPREGNRCSHHGASWVEPTGRAADTRQATARDVSRSYYGDRKV